MQQQHKYLLHNALTTGLALAAIACSGSPAPAGGDDPGGTTDVSGTWLMSDTVDASDCGDGFELDTYSLEVDQSGNNLTVTSADGTFFGTIQDRNISWTGSYYSFEDEGTVTITSLSATVSADGLTVSGNASWSFVGEFGDTCSGTTVVSGVRESSGNGGSGSLSGTWEISETGDDSNCGGSGYTDFYYASVIQNGNGLVVTTDLDTFNGTTDGNSLSWTGSYYDPDEEGTITITSMQLTITDGVEIAGTAQWNFAGDYGDFCSGSVFVQGYLISSQTLEIGTPPLAGPGLADERDSMELPAGVRLDGDADRPERRVRLAPDVDGQDRIVRDYVAFDYDFAGNAISATQVVGPGPDQVWFSADDEIGGMFVQARDSNGALLRLEHLRDAGRDGQWGGADDLLTSYVDFVRDSNGALLAVESFGAPGPDGNWRTADDVLARHVENEL
jgi:uncharacterized protein (DUF2147 family)